MINLFDTKTKSLLLAKSIQIKYFTVLFRSRSATCCIPISLISLCESLSVFNVWTKNKIYYENNYFKLFDYFIVL